MISTAHFSFAAWPSSLNYLYLQAGFMVHFLEIKFARLCIYVCYDEYKENHLIHFYWDFLFLFVNLWHHKFIIRKFLTNCLHCQTRLLWVSKREYDNRILYIILSWPPSVILLKTVLVEIHMAKLCSSFYNVYFYGTNRCAFKVHYMTG